MSLVGTIVAICIVGIYDGYCQITGRKTLSAWTWEVSRKYPFVPFAAGLVMGHLFWGNSGACP